MTPAESEYLRFKWLIPGVLAGGTHPDLSDGLLKVAPFLHAQGVGGIVTLYEEPLHPNPEELGFRYLFVETPNFQPPAELNKILCFIGEESEGVHGVLVHCFAGIGRTGTVLAAWLLQENPMLSVSEAISHVRSEYIPEYAQSRFPESKEQEEALKQFAGKRLNP